MALTRVKSPWPDSDAILCGGSRPTRGLRKPDPASAPGHAEPQNQRYERRGSAEQGSIGQVHLHDAAENREREKEHQEERRHLYPEGKAVKALDRFGKEQGSTRRDHYGEAAKQPRLSMCPQLRRSRLAQAHAKEAQIHDQNGSGCQPKTKEVEGLDDREQPSRIAYPLADRR